MLPYILIVILAGLVCWGWDKSNNQNKKHEESQAALSDRIDKLEKSYSELKEELNHFSRRAEFSYNHLIATGVKDPGLAMESLYRILARQLRGEDVSYALEEHRLLHIQTQILHPPEIPVDLVKLKSGIDMINNLYSELQRRKQASESLADRKPSSM